MIELSAWHYWLIVAGLLIGLELFIGSPYFVLLILGLASLTASAAAWFGAPVWLQLLVATVTCVGGYLLAVRIKRHEPVGSTLPFDVGARVELVRVDSGNRAEVTYRGSTWQAEADRPNLDWQAPLYVKEVRGATLLVTTERPG